MLHILTANIALDLLNLTLNNQANHFFGVEYEPS
jgi:hypothetical protein